MPPPAITGALRALASGAPGADEDADLGGIAAVAREWVKARGWLYQELRGLDA